MSLKELSEKVPVIRAKGTNYEIGRTVGEKARQQIDNNLKHLRESAPKSVGHPWPVCTEICRRFLPVIERLVPEYLEEIRGMADGSGLSFDDLYTLNCRTEIGMLFTKQRNGNLAEALKLSGECSVLGISKSRTKDGSVLYAQNWDSAYAQADTLCFFILEQAGGKPSIAWIGEAGLLCRMGGMNSCGIGMGGNTLISDGPIDFDALPLQFAYRYVMDQKTFHDAAAAAGRGGVASNINLLLAGPEGELVCMETEYRGFTMNYMENGVISHANVYKNPKGPHAPYRDAAPAQKFLRSFRLETIAKGLKGNELGVEDVKRIMTEHEPNAPESICRHDDAHGAGTVTASICNLSTLEMYVAPAHPCEGYFHVRPFEEDPGLR